jgi:YihY family inner membrane protein
MSLTGRLDGFQRRHPAAGFPLAVVYKFFDDQGTYLAALITYYGFLSLFPLLLLLSTILGLVLRGDPHLQREVLDSALGQFPVIGEDLGKPKQLGGGTTGLVVGILGSLYGGLGVGQALQNAMDTAWAVPRNRRPNPLKARGRSLLLLATVGLGVLGTTAVTALGSGAGSWAASLGAGWRVVLLAVSVAINAGVFLLAFRIATARRLRVRDIAPGAVAAAVLWQLLQSFGAVYVGHVVKGASATNGTFAVVLGLIAFIYLAAVSVVLCVEVNVVRVEKLHPRALLTPFTDDVSLTEGDRGAYTGLAQAQRNKGFEEVEVRFDEESRERRGGE